MTGIDTKDPISPKTVSDGDVVGAVDEAGHIALSIGGEVFAEMNNASAKVLLSTIEPDMKNRGHFTRGIGSKAIRSHDVKSCIRILRKLLHTV